MDNFASVFGSLSSIAVLSYLFYNYFPIAKSDQIIQAHSGLPYAILLFVAPLGGLVASSNLSQGIKKSKETARYIDKIKEETLPS